MHFKKLHPDFILPTRATDGSAALDLYLVKDLHLVAGYPGLLVGLGFSAAVPENHVALLLPRSSAGVKHNLELSNTCGVIDSDYRGEWMASLRLNASSMHPRMSWKKGERLLQMLIVPVNLVTPELVDNLPETSRGTGGFGSTGN